MAQYSDAEVREGLPTLAPRLWRYAMVLARGNRADADDLTQTAMIRAIENASQFQPGSRLEKWCFSILNSVWKNELRARSSRRGAGLVSVEDADLMAPDTTDMNIQAREVLTRMMDLPDAMRETLFLVYVEGYSYAETSERMDIPIGTVMSRLANGRKRLNAAMVNENV